MKVEWLLQQKGNRVVTVAAEAPIPEAVRRLRDEGIGAMVVTDGTDRILGIISERDVVRGLAEHGEAISGKTVADFMTRAVKTCRLESDIIDIMSEMTESRIRHLPVVEGEKLVGIVSIGDVVKHRLSELEEETTVLRDYVTGRI